jgi:hypothetical protein
LFHFNGGVDLADGFSRFLNASRVNANGACQLAVRGVNHTRLDNSTVYVDDVTISAPI